jgi:RNA polymerase sigma-70 factor (ECF subfamily)
MDAGDALVEVLREQGPRVLGTLMRQFGNLSVAEDALSEATIAALGAWPGSGIPDNPRAWLTVVARRKALDLLRRSRPEPTRRRQRSDGERSARKKRWRR